MSTPLEQAIAASLSASRIQTYENALPGNATALYAWNAQVSSAFLVPLHICEVVVRNGIAAVIEQVYGANWPWAPGFQKSLKSPAGKNLYSPRGNLLAMSQKFATTGKVIPELKFVFWPSMMTARHDQRLWTPYIRQAFPNLPPQYTEAQCRAEFYRELEQIRFLRNRIAHHEPIFNRALNDDFSRLCKLINWRCIQTEQWMRGLESVTGILAQRPY